MEGVKLLPWNVIVSSADSTALYPWLNYLIEHNFGDLCLAFVGFCSPFNGSNFWFMAFPLFTVQYNTGQVYPTSSFLHLFPSPPHYQSQSIIQHTDSTIWLLGMIRTVPFLEGRHSFRYPPPNVLLHAQRSKLQMGRAFTLAARRFAILTPTPWGRLSQHHEGGPVSNAASFTLWEKISLLTPCCPQITAHAAMACRYR